MGTETSMKEKFDICTPIFVVKLNNPLMGTETVKLY